MALLVVPQPPLLPTATKVVMAVGPLKTQSLTAESPSFLQLAAMSLRAPTGPLMAATSFTVPTKGSTVESVPRRIIIALFLRRMERFCPVLRAQSLAMGRLGVATKTVILSCAAVSTAIIPLTGTTLCGT